MTMRMSMDLLKTDERVWKESKKRKLVYSLLKNLPNDETQMYIFMVKYRDLIFKANAEKNNVNGRITNSSVQGLFLKKTLKDYSLDSQLIGANMNRISNLTITVVYLSRYFK